MPDSDPFQVAVPGPNEFGRVFRHGVLVAGWPCRWCLTALQPQQRGSVACPTCDRAPAGPVAS